MNIMIIWIKSQNFSVWKDLTLYYISRCRLFNAHKRRFESRKRCTLREEDFSNVCPSWWLTAKRQLHSLISISRRLFIVSVFDKLKYIYKTAKTSLYNVQYILNVLYISRVKINWKTICMYVYVLLYNIRCVVGIKTVRVWRLFFEIENEIATK